ncbi:MAG: NAD(P)H-dependent oxidoreductase [Corynebacterium sp.]|nr:NAD(P)H-dependent oxidoreductase [Corynebacterium sp.]
MRIAVFVFHPQLNHSSINSALANKLGAHEDVVVRDMYSLYPNFLIDVAAEHAVLESVDRIILQFPAYWYSAPALLKQWLDMVLTPGWAYEGGEHLRGKEFLVLTSYGGDINNAEHKAYQNPDGTTSHPRIFTAEELLRPIQATIQYVGGVYLRPLVLTGCSYMDDAQLAKEVDAAVHEALSSDVPAA